MPAFEGRAFPICARRMHRVEHPTFFLQRRTDASKTTFVGGHCRRLHSTPVLEYNCTDTQILQVILQYNVLQYSRVLGVLQYTFIYNKWTRGRPTVPYSYFHGGWRLETQYHIHRQYMTLKRPNTNCTLQLFTAT